MTIFSFQTLFDRVLALVLLIVHAPIMAGVAVVLLISQGRPVLYRGPRLGLGGKPFNIYKFRTLRQGAEAELGSEMLAHHHGLETPLGPFLRDTRIDELPQLFNVLRGDMAFIGPRPMRRAVARLLKAEGEDLSVRLKVLPGLVGPAHLFTPHGTSERLRRRLRRFSGLGSGGAGNAAFLMAATAWALVRRVFLAFKISCHHCTGARPTARRACTLRGRGDWGVCAFLPGGDRLDGVLAEIGETALVAVFPRAIKGEYLFRLVRHVYKAPKRGRGDERRASRDKTPRAKRPCCHGLVMSSASHPGGGHAHVVCYTADGEFSQYLIDKYFLRKSLL